jgi:hypothetical protein
VTIEVDSGVGYAVWLQIRIEIDRDLSIVVAGVGSQIGKGYLFSVAFIKKNLNLSLARNLNT